MQNSCQSIHSSCNLATTSPEQKLRKISQADIEELSSDQFGDYLKSRKDQWEIDGWQSGQSPAKESKSSKNQNSTFLKANTSHRRQIRVKSTVSENHPESTQSPIQTVNQKRVNDKRNYIRKLQEKLLELHELNDKASKSKLEKPNKQQISQITTSETEESKSSAIIVPQQQNYNFMVHSPKNNKGHRKFIPYSSYHSTASTSPFLKKYIDSPQEYDHEGTNSQGIKRFETSSRFYQSNNIGAVSPSIAKQKSHSFYGNDSQKWNGHPQQDSRNSENERFGETVRNPPIISYPLIQMKRINRNSVRNKKKISRLEEYILNCKQSESVVNTPNQQHSMDSKFRKRKENSIVLRQREKQLDNQARTQNRSMESSNVIRTNPSTPQKSSMLKSKYGRFSVQKNLLSRDLRISTSKQFSLITNNESGNNLVK